MPDGFIGVLAGCPTVESFALAEFFGVVYCGDGMFGWGYDRLYHWVRDLDEDSEEENKGGD